MKFQRNITLIKEESELRVYSNCNKCRSKTIHIIFKVDRKMNICKIKCSSCGHFKPRYYNLDIVKEKAKKSELLIK